MSEVVIASTVQFSSMLMIWNELLLGKKAVVTNFGKYLRDTSNFIIPIY